MKKPKVLVDVFYLHVAQTGIKTYFVSLCEEILKREDKDFDYVFSPDYPAIKNRKFFRGKTARWKNILFQLIYFFRKQFILPFISFYYKADLVFSPDIISPIWCRGKKVSVVYDTFFWESPDHYHGIWLKFFLFNLKIGVKYNADIFTITQYSKDKLREIEAFDHVPISVVYPASGLGVKKGQSQKIQKPPFRYFLHVGVMEKRKNLGMLIEAFAGLSKQESNRDLKLVLVGSKGPRKNLDDYDNIIELIKKHQLEDKVVFPGYVTEEELSGYFHHAIAYTFPSLNEGFGLPVLEAFSFGLPVIISDQGALKEVVGDAALVLKENTKESLQSAMELLLKNENLRIELSEKGRKRLNEFTTEKFFLSLEQAFKQILNG